MTRRQLEEDVFNAESEHYFDYEEDHQQYELRRVQYGLDCVADALFSFTGDSIY